MELKEEFNTQKTESKLVTAACPVCARHMGRLSKYKYRCFQCNKDFYIYPSNKVKIFSTQSLVTKEKLDFVGKEHEKDFENFIKSELLKQLTSYLLENNCIKVEKENYKCLHTTKITESIEVILPEEATFPEILDDKDEIVETGTPTINKEPLTDFTDFKEPKENE